MEISVEIDKATKEGIQRIKSPKKNTANVMVIRLVSINGRTMEGASTTTTTTMAAIRMQLEHIEEASPVDKQATTRTRGMAATTICALVQVGVALIGGEIGNYFTAILVMVLPKGLSQVITT